MYSGLDRRVHFSAEDLAMGAVDLAEIEEETVNNTLAVANSTLHTAVSVVKEAAPRIIETIVKNLVPVFSSSSQPTVSPSLPHSANNPLQFPSFSVLPEVSASPPLETPILPEVLVSPPVETIIIIPHPGNTSYPIVPTAHDTVIT
jgi:hypothetical protein